MIEFIDNLLQFFMSLFCCVLSGVMYWRNRRQPCFLLTCFYGCFALGGLYWTLFLLLFAQTPRTFYVAEIAWLSGYSFLNLLQHTIMDKEEKAFKSRAFWPVLAVSVFLLLFYCTFGDIFSNIVISVMLLPLFWYSVRGLIFLCGLGSEKQTARFFHVTILCFVILEHCLWLSSCFWVGDSLTNPYFWFDFLLTAWCPLLLVAVRKAVACGLH